MIRDVMVEIINDDDKDYHIVRQIMSYDPLTYGEYIIVRLESGNYINGLICYSMFRSSNYRKIEDRYNKLVVNNQNNAKDIAENIT